MLLRCVLWPLLAHVGVLAITPNFVGVWTSPPAALPNPLLPDVPLAGNGFLGVLLDSHGDNLDVWLSSNNMWSCRAISGTANVNGTCGKIALGGVSIASSANGAPPLAFTNLSQTIASGTLSSAWVSSAGGVLTTSTRIHPTQNVIVTQLLWSPSQGDVQSLNVTSSTWVLAASSQHGAPAPDGAYCSDGKARAPCGTTATLAGVVTRVAATGADAETSPHPVWAALASVVVGAPLLSLTAMQPVGKNWNLDAAFQIAAGSPVYIITAEAESYSFAVSTDPGVAAASLALSFSTPEAAQSVGTASDAFWAEFYGRSSVTLPPPYLQTLYDGAAYILASTASTDSAVAAPGLYGVWATTDGCYWNGDYTLDYNQESTFFGAFSTNHAEQFASYASPLVDFAPAGTAGAQTEAAAAHITCPPSAQHFACHLAPWGLQSDDQSVYMHWNLPFGLLPVLNQWEFTHDVEAARTAWPLISGAVDWLGCFLQRNASTGALHDVNAFNGDAEHEGQIVPDPQIGIALAHRVAAASLDIALGLGIQPPAAAADVVANLVRYNVGTTRSPDANFTILQNFRYKNDYLMTNGVSSVTECESICAADGDCGCFTWCDHGTVGCPDGPSCWKYHPDAQGDGGPDATNFTSGCKTGSPTHNISVWVAYAGATTSQSDTFATYPGFPSEMFSMTRLTDADRLIGQASSTLYGLSPKGQSGRPLDVFSSAAVTLAGAKTVISPDASSAAALLDGLRGYCAVALGRNALNYAPGGGIENAGLSRALTDLLLFSAPLTPVGSGELATWFARLFAVWPSTEDADFKGLLAKGGCTFSAALVNGTVSSPVSIAAAYSSDGNCSLAHPWPSSPRAGITAACDGVDTPLEWLVVPAAGGGTEDVLSLIIPKGSISCAVSLS